MFIIDSSTPNGVATIRTLDRQNHENAWLRVKLESYPIENELERPWYMLANYLRHQGQEKLDPTDIRSFDVGIHSRHRLASQIIGRYDGGPDCPYPPDVRWSPEYLKMSMWPPPQREGAERAQLQVISLDYAKAPAEGNNPLGLTNETVGVGNGWRLLVMGELVTGADELWSQRLDSWYPAIAKRRGVLERNSHTIRTWVGPNDKHLIRDPGLLSIVNSEGEAVSGARLARSTEVSAGCFSVVLKDGDSPRRVVVNKMPFPRRCLRKEVDQDPAPYLEVLED